MVLLQKGLLIGQEFGVSPEFSISIPTVSMTSADEKMGVNQEEWWISGIYMIFLMDSDVHVLTPIVNHSKWSPSSLILPLKGGLLIHFAAKLNVWCRNLDGGWIGIVECKKSSQQKDETWIFHMFILGASKNGMVIWSYMYLFVILQKNDQKNLWISVVCWALNGYGSKLGTPIIGWLTLN